MTVDFLIVGAGFSGAVLAERLASQAGLRSLVIDRRDHIAGNAYDCADDHGNIIHPYGPHYFRTNSDKVRAYLDQFTAWRAVDYKVLSWTEGRYWQFPINLHTYEQLVGHSATSEEMRTALAEWRVPIAHPQNSEEAIISQVGWRLYEMFFKNYTLKQWGSHPRDLDPAVCRRIPIRTDRNDHYLAERFQALPADGYTALFQRLLDHPLIETSLNTSFRDVQHTVRWKHLIWTGPIDDYYAQRHGALPYRSLRFEHDLRQTELSLPALQVNYPNDHAYTREVELKHITGQQSASTTVVREYPQEYTAGTEPFYPMPTEPARRAYEAYKTLAAAETNVSFVGRLACYQYFNMDQVIALALQEADRLHARYAPETDMQATAASSSLT